MLLNPFRIAPSIWFRIFQLPLPVSAYEQGLMPVCKSVWDRLLTAGVKSLPVPESKTLQQS